MAKRLKHPKEALCDAMNGEMLTINVGTLHEAITTYLHYKEGAPQAWDTAHEIIEDIRKVAKEYPDQIKFH